MHNHHKVMDVEVKSCDENKCEVRSPIIGHSGHLTPANNSVKISLITHCTVKTAPALSNEVSLSYLPPL